VRCHHALEPDTLPLERSDARRVPVVAEDALLRVTGLAASYGSAQVVHDIDLAVEENECLAVVGESGSGKTTLARCIGGLHRDWTGEMSWEGAPLAAGARARSLDTRRQIQYVFQNPYSSLYPRRTVGQTLARQLELFDKSSKRDTATRVGDVLEQVSLSRHAASMFPDQLSGGERQRVAIARAIVVRPRLLLCDEVTSALDVSVQAAVVALLAELRERMGLTMVFITHNLALIRSVADRVVVMTGGRIVEQGLSDDVFSSPESSYTRDLLASSPVVEGVT
jgi:peptide/nickel transport system ATP-binding protein